MSPICCYLALSPLHQAERSLKDVRGACLSQQLVLPSAGVVCGINMPFMPLELNETKSCFQLRHTGANPGEG